MVMLLVLLIPMMEKGHVFLILTFWMMFLGIVLRILTHVNINHKRVMVTMCVICQKPGLKAIPLLIP